MGAFLKYYGLITAYTTEKIDNPSCLQELSAFLSTHRDLKSGKKNS